MSAKAAMDAGVMSKCSDLPPKSLSTLKYKELQAMAKGYSIKANLSKNKLIEQILARTASSDQSSEGATVKSSHGNVEDLKDPVSKSLADADDYGGPPGGQIQPSGIGDNGGRVRNDGRESCARPKADFATSVDAIPNDEAPESGTSTQHDTESSDKSTPGSCLNSAEQEGPSDEAVTQGTSGIADKLLETRRGTARALADQVQNGAAPAKTPRQSTAAKLATHRSSASTAFRRFDAAHRNIFEAQPSIELYGKTPRKTGAAKENLASRPLTATKSPLSVLKHGPKASAVTPAHVGGGSGVGSSAKAGRRGTTIASKPCTLVVQRSNKKPTEVKEFRLSTTAGKREGFTFTPYTGPVRPLVPVTSSGENVPTFNIGRAPANKRVSHKHTRKPSRSLAPAGIKSTLASGKARAARKAAHVESRKTLRGKVVEGARAGRA